MQPKLKGILQKIQALNREGKTNPTAKAAKNKNKLEHKPALPTILPHSQLTIAINKRKKSE